MTSETNTNPASFPPRHVFIAAALVICSGVGSVIGMIAAMAASKMDFDLGFVGIPIGYGLMIGRSSSRRWALFFSCLGLLMVGGLVTWGLFRHFTGEPVSPFFGNLQNTSLIVGAGAASLYVFIALLTKRNRLWFEDFKEGTPPVKSFVWAVIAVSTILLSSQHITEWWTKDSRNKMYPFDVTVTPYNAETGEGVSSLTWDGRDDFNNDQPMGKLSKVGFASGSEGDRATTIIQFAGIATKPFDVMIKSEGFRDTPVRIDSDTEGEIRVAMQPIKD